MSNRPDPFLLEILKKGFDTIADDMAINLMRTAYSVIVRDSMDFSTAILDPKGRTLAQGVTTPLHLGSFYDAMQNLVAKVSETMQPGDVFIFNDPYEANGQHLPDIYIVKPIFAKEMLCGWACALAHHSDVGGIVAGSNAIGASEIYQEGLRIPVLKFMDRGEPVSPVWDLIAINVRLPELVLGDLQSQVASCLVGEREMLELFDKHGLDNVIEYFDHLHDHAERMARAVFTEIPDGSYSFVDHIDGLGEEPEDVVLNLVIHIDGDRAIADWSGSSPQVKAGINSPLPFTRAAVFAGLRAIMPDEVPNCHGYTRAIEVLAPAGTVVNPVLPGACGARGITGFRMIDCIFGALAQAVPERIAADGNGGATLPTISGWTNGQPFIFCETFMGNSGGTATHDGQEGTSHVGSNQSNVPVEIIESTFPIRVETYAIVPDSGGPGRYRGGQALVREFRLLSDEADLNVRSDKRKHPPHGLFGGLSGTPSWNVVISGHEERVLPVLLTEPAHLKKGDVFRHVLAGAGGYGDPLERNVDAVWWDVIEEKISQTHALEAYGVLFKQSEVLEVDLAGTEVHRAKMRGARGGEGIAV
jgi:N-methylhydantoinase B